jgi:hypothetical protein
MVATASGARPEDQLLQAECLIVDRVVDSGPPLVAEDDDGGDAERGGFASMPASPLPKSASLALADFDLPSRGTIA